MTSKFRTIIRKLLIVIDLAFAFVFILACLSPYLNPVKWWFISWLGLIFPVLLLLMIISFVFWVFFRPRYSWFFLAALLIGWKSIRVFFAFNGQREFKYEKPKDVLRIVSWNVARFIEIRRNNDAGSQTRLKMMRQLLEQNADVLCLQEFYSATREDYYNNISYIKRYLNYPYYYFAFDEDGSKQYFSSVIFSRLPLIDTEIVVFPRPSTPEKLLRAGIKFNGDTIRIFTTHLQSVHFKKGDYERIHKIKNYEEGIVSNSRTIFSKLKRGIVYRSLQTDIIKIKLQQSKYPVIFCGDFNDVPNSYTYFTVRGNLQDAFLEKGSGIGRTFNAIAPTLRIDYILASKEFTVLQFDRLVKNYSDHYMLVTDLKLPGHQQ